MDENVNWEQQHAEIRDVLPGCWWAIYSGCIGKGFSPSQAFELLRVYIFCNGTGNRSLPSGDVIIPPEPEEEE